MAKFAITKRTTTIPTSTVDPTVTKAVRNSTPLAHAFAEKIMSYYTPVAPEYELSHEEQAIQDLFSKWSNDDVSNRLAALTELITGFKPVVAGAPANFPIGKLFKTGAGVHATVYVDSTFAYGINATGTARSHVCLTTTASAGTSAHVTRAEAGEFAKALLNVKGIQIVAFITAQFDAQALTPFLTALGDKIEI